MVRTERVVGQRLHCGMWICSFGATPPRDRPTEVVVRSEILKQMEAFVIPFQIFRLDFLQKWELQLHHLKGKGKDRSCFCAAVGLHIKELRLH